jgi:peptide/nickel transport system substrate-binding protein
MRARPAGRMFVVRKSTMARARFLVAVTAVVAVAGSLVAAGGASRTAASAPVTVAFSSKIQTLDPAIAVAFPDQAALHLIGGTLTTYASGKLSPGLASSYQVSSNGLTWTFTLRKGVRFSNGTPLTSADVKATLDRARNDKSNANLAEFLPITNITAPNAGTVVITMNRKYASLPTILGGPPWSIYPASLITAKGFFNDPISAGPYVLTAWGGTNTATFAVNKSYWGPKPAVPEIEFQTNPDPNSALAEVESGQLDIAFGLPPNLISQVRTPAQSEVTTMYGEEVMTMRGAAAPFNQQALRVAISDALNRQQMSQVIYGGKVPPIKGYWPSSMNGYDPTISTAQDLAAAKQEIAGTSCAKGCQVTLDYCSAAYPEQGPEALVVQSNLAQIGVKVKLDNLDPSTYFNIFATYKYQMVLYPLYDFQNVPDGYLGFSLIYAGGQQAAYTGLSIKPIEAQAHAIEVSSGGARAKDLLQLNKLFAQYSPFTTLTDEALIWATRPPTSEIHVSSSAFLDVATS